MKKYANGILVDLTSDEIAEANARQKAWDDDSSNRKLKLIKDLRKDRLQATDWMANSDYTMPDYIKTWRQTLRDLPQNNTTESQYDTLLARDSDGKFTNSVWTQPTE
ncbi:phage tail assembly chaperone [bacterium]|nr:phage tail assembly chaperone [bacterium]